MQCPNCGLVVRGLPDVFAQPIRCPDCKVKAPFKPESASVKPESASGKPVWKKVPFVVGVGLAAAIVLSLAALAYSRHQSRSDTEGGVSKKPRPTKPSKAEEKADSAPPVEEPPTENPVEEPEGESPVKVPDSENSTEEQEAETVP